MQRKRTFERLYDAQNFDLGQEKEYTFTVIIRKNAGIAQLDRAFGFEPKGRGFKSLCSHHKILSFTGRVFVFLAEVRMGLDSTLQGMVPCKHYPMTPSKNDIANTEAQMRKGVLELCILLVLAKRGEMYASDILTALKTHALLVVEGTLYPLLNRLKSEEFLDYRWEESQSGPPRKYYRVTAKGKQASSKLLTHWNNLAATITSLT